MVISKMCVARRGAVPPVSEQFADERQILAGHHGVAGQGGAPPRLREGSKLLISAV